MSTITSYFKERVWWRVLLLYAVMISVFAWPVILHNNIDKKVRAESLATISRMNTETTGVEEKVNAHISGKPVRIVISSLGIDLSVVPGNYDASNKTWQVSNTAANYATNTKPANNDSGATLIYGHATNIIFGKLKNLQDTDKVLVYTDTNYIFSYSKQSSSVIIPTDTTLFTNINSEKPTLQLLTCDGYWSQNRLLINLGLDGVL